MNFLSLINAFSWLAADLQMLLMCKLKFSLSSNCRPKFVSSENTYTEWAANDIPALRCSIIARKMRFNV